MNNKYTKSIRLNEEEYNIIQEYSTYHNISISESIRECIRMVGISRPNASKQNAEIAKSFCIIHARLDEQRIFDKEIEEEFQKICQMLS